MPLVTCTRCFEGYPLDALPPSLQEHLRACPRWSRQLAATALRLQCFCELKGHSLVGQSCQYVNQVLGDFAAAIFSKIFRSEKNTSNPWNALGNLRRALPAPFEISYPSTANCVLWSSRFRERVAELSEMELDSELEYFWTGWTAKNAGGQNTSLRFWRFYRRYGQERTLELHKACADWYAKGRFCRFPVIEKFSDFLVDSEPVDFSNSASLGQAIAQFFPIYFRSGHEAGVRLLTLSVQWRHFSKFLRDHLLGHAWATPLPAIPRPRLKAAIGARTNLTTDHRGREIKKSLITEVPLHVTDAEAIELLFRDIKQDVDNLRKWAETEIDEARKRLARRKEIAPVGTKSEASQWGVTNGLRHRLSRDCSDYLAHAAATFEAHSFDHISKRRQSSTIYPEPSALTAWELGLPTPALLLAHASLLVIEHPKITPAFLADLELFDCHGKQIGLVQTDAGWYLRGVKRRRGARLAEQDVLLTKESLQVVRDVVEMTMPLRAWLRRQRNECWRKLFLVTPSMGVPPKGWDPNNEALRQQPWLARRLEELVGLEPVEAARLASRFTLKKLRCSRGVLVYLETGSVEQMAKALGHKRWQPRLLDHYLPRPIQAFFTERWIRLFQQGLVCEALRGSPYLLEATAFANMTELDQFLEHHAIRRIPAHLENPDNVGGTASKDTTDSVVFGVEVGILTILLSLEAAVRTAHSTPCGRAIRWARISERLVAHLESQAEQPEFHAMVHQARQHASPALVEGLIYA